MVVMYIHTQQIHWLELTCVLLALASELLEERNALCRTGENIILYSPAS